MLRLILIGALIVAAGCGGGSSPGTPQSQVSDPAAGDSPSPTTQDLTITLDWLPPTSNDNDSTLVDLAGYTIYAWHDGESEASAVWHVDNPGLSAYVVDLPQGGEWLIGMTAVNTRGQESTLSNTVSLSL